MPVPFMDRLKLYIRILHSENIRMLVTLDSTCLVAELVSISLALIAPTAIITGHLSEVFVNKSLNHIITSIINLLIAIQRYGDGAGNTADENSSVFSLIRMR